MLAKSTVKVDVYVQRAGAGENRPICKAVLGQVLLRHETSLFWLITTKLTRLCTHQVFFWLSCLSLVHASGQQVTRFSTLHNPTVGDFLRLQNTPASVAHT
jgi:hypothetical protein